MRLRSRSTVAVAVLGALLILLARHQRWFAGEPVVRGRTVTEWLDTMPFFAGMRERDDPWNPGFVPPFSPTAVTNDPAILALRSTGSNAIPTLLRRLLDGPAYPASARIADAVAWGADQVTSDNPLPRPASPGALSGVEFARKHAAALALLMLDARDGGGLPPLARLAAAGLGRAGPAASNHLHVLRTAMKEPNVHLQRAVLQAIRKIEPATPP